MVRPEIVDRPIRKDDHRHRHEGEQHGEENDLEDRIGPAQRLDDRVMGGEQPEAQDGKSEAAQRRCLVFGWFRAHERVR